MVHEKNKSKGIFFTITQMLSSRFDMRIIILMNQLHLIRVCLRLNNNTVLITGRPQETIDSILIVGNRFLDLLLMFIDLPL